MLDRILPLIADPDRLGAVGYGAGGSIMLELASAGAPFKALAAIHHGLATACRADWTNVAGPGLHGIRRPRVPA